MFLTVRRLSDAALPSISGKVKVEGLRGLTASISRLKRTGDWEQALLLLFAAATKPDIIAYTAAASVCAKAAAWAYAVALLKQSERMCLNLDGPFWNSIGSACSAAGKWQHALWLLLSAPKHSAGVLPNIVAYSAAMAACERVSLWETVLGLLLEMRQKNLAAGPHAYSSAVLGCGSVFAWQRSLLLYAELVQESTAGANVVALNATLTALERAARWPLALHLLDRNTVPQLDGISYSTVIAACCKKRHWQMALNLLTTAINSQVMPSPGAFSCLARALGHGRAWQTAIDLIQAIQVPTFFVVLLLMR